VTAGAVGASGALTLGALPAAAFSSTNASAIAPLFLSALKSALEGGSGCTVTIMAVTDSATGVAYYRARRAAAAAVVVTFRAVGSSAAVAAATSAQTSAFTAAVTAAVSTASGGAFAGVTITASSSDATAVSSGGGDASRTGLYVGVGVGALVLLLACGVALVWYKRPSVSKLPLRGLRRARVSAAAEDAATASPLRGAMAGPDAAAARTEAVYA
jgi:hypothetical protein